MKKTLQIFFTITFFFSLAVFISCEDAESLACSGCPDDAPYGTVDGGCYATESECENNESGNCLICQ